MRNHYLSLLIVVLMLCVSLAQVVPLSAASGPTLIARVSAVGSPARIATFNAAGQSRTLYSIDPTLDYLEIAYSPDLQWIGAGGIPPNAQQPVLAYRRVNGSPIGIPLPPGAALGPIHFTDDSAYMLYSWTTLQTGEAAIGIVTLANGQRREFVTNYQAGSIFGRGIAGQPVHFDGRTLWAVGIVPFSDAFLQGFFSLDLNLYFFAGTGRYPMPGARRILGPGEYSSPAVSPDGRLAAVLYFDRANPPSSPLPGLGFTVNSLAVIDLQTGAPARRIAAAGPGQGLEMMSWAPNSRSIYFTGGDYREGRLPNARLFSVDVAFGQVRELGRIAEGLLLDMRVCGDRVYSVLQGDGGLPLLSTPLNNLAGTQVLLSGRDVRLLNCTAR